METYIFSNEIAPLVLGANDKNLSYLELLLGCNISLKGNSITADNPHRAIAPFFSRLEKIARERGMLTESEIFMELNLLDEDENTLGFSSNDLTSSGFTSNERVHDTISVLGKTIWPKSNSQKRMIRSLDKDQVVFAYGPAGTGKTFIAIAWALQEIFAGRKNKLVMTRPVVEAGESLGFLPGDLSQKLNPYLRPLYDAMDFMITPQHIKRLEECGSIEIAPLAYMRGRSLNNSVVILDEAQNTTSLQMKMFLTRLGENTQAIITGDPTQIDLRDKKGSGLVEAIDILNGIKSISMIRFTHVDTVRSQIVREIVRAYSGEKEYGNE